MKLETISTVTIISTISTVTNLLGNHYKVAVKMGQNHKITDNMIIEIHILQTEW